jgi:hypothetical protein
MNPGFLAMACLALLFQLPAEDDLGSTVPGTTASSEVPLRVTSASVIPKEGRIQNDLRFIVETPTATGVVEHSPAFRKAARDAWRATQNGTKPYEAGFSIDKDGRPGKIQTSMGAPGDAVHHLKIISNSTAMGTLHVHNKFAAPEPSDDDIKAAKSLHKIVYVASREGLYSVGPDGKVIHVFNRPDWFDEK